MTEGTHADSDQLDFAVEVFVDLVLPLLEGKDDDDLVFVDGLFRGVATHLGLCDDFPEIEPMLASELRRRWRASKERLAAGELPLGGER